MEKETPPKGEIVIYTSADGKISLDAKLENETIWLTQDMMAKLFETTPQNITMHIKNIYEDEELEQNSTCKDFLQVRNEGKRTVSRKLFVIETKNYKGRITGSDNSDYWTKNMFGNKYTSPNKTYQKNKR